MHAFPAGVLAVLLLTVPTLHARASQATAPAEQRVLDTAMVQGVVPGPGMWKVRKGDNTFWILGVQSPLPARMEWNAGKVRAVIAKADALIAPPTVSVGSDIGFFGTLALAPSLLKLRNNPNGKMLRDVVPPASYGRWVPLRQRYLGNGGGIEKRRPIIASTQLYERAMDQAGLVGSARALRALDKAVKRRGLKWTPSTASFKVNDPKGAVRELRGQQLADIECFDRTLERLESDVDNMRLRANAWALGDIAALRRLQRPDQYEACTNALLESAVAARHGVRDANRQARDKWLSNAESALERNQVTFGTLSMRDLLASDGVLARLAAKGYVVEAPAGPATALAD